MNLWDWTIHIMLLIFGLLMSSVFGPLLMGRAVAGNSFSRQDVFRLYLSSLAGAGAAFVGVMFSAAFTGQMLEDAHWIPSLILWSAMWLAISTWVTDRLYRINHTSDTDSKKKRGRMRLAALVSSLGLLLIFLGCRLK